MTPRRVSVLSLDPDLAELLEGEAIEQARARCTAELVALPSGWLPKPLAVAGASDCLGLLVLSGVLVYRVSVAGRETVDLVGPGDLIRPWHPAVEYGDPGAWRALGPVHLGCLDRQFIRQTAPWPEIAIRLAQRMADHVDSLTVRLAVAQIPQVSLRLQIVLWELADRFGYVDGDGVVVPLRLSHQLIAEFVSARREVVSRRLAELRVLGVVTPDHRGWRLHGTRPTGVVPEL
jgi:CRP/FNR family transcriptional regulator, cyclic AMP receptor protein